MKWLALGDEVSESYRFTAGGTLCLSSRRLTRTDTERLRRVLNERTGEDVEQAIRERVARQRRQDRAVTRDVKAFDDRLGAEGES